MKLYFVLLVCLVSGTNFSQNHDSKPIRFIFESIHDHLGNLDINSKRVQLFSPDHHLLYEADLYDGKELDEQFFYYDQEGKLLRDHRIFHQPHESGDFRMKYDDNGNLIEETNINDKDEILERISMTYDAKGNKISEKKEFLHHFEDKMIPESFFEFTYDQEGRIATKTGWEDEKEDKIVTYKYKHEALKETITKYDAKNVILEKWITKKDTEGRLLEDVHSLYKAGQAPVTKTIVFTYDEHDHILTEVLSKSNSSLKKQIIFDYVYDDHGNWIERSERKVMGAKKTEGVHLKRYIEYYEHDEYEHPPMELDESWNWEVHDGKEVKLFQETHVRINNNERQLEWVVRRNGPDIFQLDEYEYKAGRLDRINHLNHQKGDNAYTLAKYDEQGKMTEKTSYSSQGIEDEKILFEYDSKGRLAKKEERFIVPSQAELKTEIIEEYKYDGSGKMVKMELFEYGSEYSLEYEYDGNGRVTKEIQTPNSKDEEVITTTYQYDGKKLVEEVEYDGKEKEVATRITYEYDSRGELIKTAHYRAGTIHSEVDYVYFE